MNERKKAMRLTDYEKYQLALQMEKIPQEDLDGKSRQQIVDMIVERNKETGLFQNGIPIRTMVYYAKLVGRKWRQAPRTGSSSAREVRLNLIEERLDDLEARLDRIEEETNTVMHDLYEDTHNGNGDARKND